MQAIIDWFYEKGHNGNFTKESGDILRLIAMSKFIDGVLFVGSHNGLEVLHVKQEVPNAQFHVITDEDQNKLRTIFQKAYALNIGLFKPTAVMSYGNYDIAYFKEPQEDLQRLKTISGRLMPDAFLIFNYDVTSEEIQAFIDNGVRTAKAYKKIKIAGLTIIKL